MKNRQKPNSSRSFAGTGEAPISINNESRLDKAIADSTKEKAIRIAILEEENRKLQLRVEAQEEQIEDLQQDDQDDEEGPSDS